MKLGVDIGTSFTKVVGFDDAGEVVGVRSASTALRRLGGGRIEYDVAEAVQTIIRPLRDLAPGEVEFVAVTGQGDGLWLLDDHSRPVGNALAWLDARGGEACARWAESGVLAKIFALTGNAPFPGAGAALLATLDLSAPDTLAAASVATQCQHAVFECLTGVRTATRSAAMLPLVDPRTGRYHDDVVRLCGLDHRRALLPNIASDPAVAAPVTTGRFGVPAGTPIVTGPYDLPAAAAGAGRMAEGDGLLIIGTTLACLVATRTVPSAGEPVGLTLRAAADDGYLRAMPAMVGTACLDWVLGLVGAEHSDLGRLLATTEPGARGVRALPYLSPAGERAPFTDPAARAELSGMSLETTESDVVRAVCESLAFAARHCFEAAGLSGDLTVCGGGSVTPQLLQIFADVLGRPLRPSADEPAARGAVLTADRLIGGGPVTPPHAARDERVIPDARAATRYDVEYAEYLDRVRRARHTWQRGQRATGGPA